MTRNKIDDDIEKNTIIDSLAFKNEVPCDSIEWSNRCTSDLIFRNLKLNETTLIIVSQQTNEEFLTQTIKPQDENRIDISSLAKGIYYLELSDAMGIVCRNIFIKK